MKTNLRLLATLTFAGLLVSPALADQKLGTNVPPLLAPTPVVETPAPVVEVKPATPAPKKKSAPKKTSKSKAAAPKAKAAKKPVAPAYSTPLKPGTASVNVKAVNVRGKPTIYSEVLTRLTNGEPVTVIEEITRDNAKADDPTVWAKISAPTTVHLWVSGQFVDSNKVVTVKKLNIRTGAGENYSVAGTMLKGEVVKDVGVKDGWLEVESTANNFAYVAAAYLKQESAATALPVEIANAPTETAPIAPPPSGELVPANQLPGAKPAEVTAPTAAPTAVAPAPVEPRIVQREGVVRRTFSIQAPTTFALVNADTGKTVNYLYTKAKDLDLRRYKGLRIIVTGEEGLDERWLNTPVITIQKIQVVE